MSDYHINIFWSDEDESSVADIPGLKYCSALGDTPEEARAEVEKPKEAWLATALDRGQAPPEPHYRPAIYQVAWYGATTGSSTTVTGGKEAAAARPARS